MQKNQSFVIALALILLLPCFSVAQNISLRQSNGSGIYKTGDPIRVTAFFGGEGADSVSIKVLNNYHPVEEKHVKITGDSIVLFAKNAGQPCSMIFEIKAGGHFAATGLVVEPEKFGVGTKRPRDFDRYWEHEKKALRKLPWDIKSVPVENVADGFVCSDVELNTTGPKPARGYFAKPVSAGPKSLPIVLFVHAAGVKGPWCLARPETAINYSQMGKGALAFDLNAHGMLNGQPQQYYDDLEAGELKGYFFKGIENREDFYFRGMYLRMIRTLDFLAAQPEWDGKRIIVIGESQGGGQALAAAGLDPRVTMAVATVPALCDWGGTLAGNKGGWPQPFSQNGNQEKMLETLPYFDVAHLLKNSKATLVVEIGFVDHTCPSNSIYAAINQSKGEKIIFAAPYRGHQLEQKQFQKTWEETIYRPKMEIIEEMMK